MKYVMPVWKKNLFVLWICNFLLMASVSSIVPFLPLYLQELGMTEEQNVSLWAGMIYAANFLTAFIFAPIWGRLGDRLGRKWMVVRSGVGMAVVMFLMSLAMNQYHLLLLRLLNGVLAGFIPAATALVAAGSPEKRMGYAMGVLQSGAVAGGICGPLFGGLLADFIGLRMVFSFIGVFVFLAAILVALLVTEATERSSSAESRGFGKDFLSIIARKPIFSLFIIAMLIQLGMMGTLPIIPLYVQEIAPTAVYITFLSGLATAVMGFASMLSSPQLGKIGDRYGVSYVLLCCCLGAVIFSIPQAIVQELWQLVVLRFLLGVCMGGMLPCVNALIRQYAPKGMEGRTYGYASSIMFIGMLTGPVCFGYLAGITGTPSIFIWSAIVCAITMVWVYSVLFLPNRQL